MEQSQVNLWLERGRKQTQVREEVREDEHQQQLFQECIELLLAAGFHRARIRALGGFQRIIQGILWALKHSGQEVEANWLPEDATIGQKIQCTERIVKCVESMKYTHQIQPHQLQGLDMSAIHPLIQWLLTIALAQPHLLPPRHALLSNNDNDGSNKMSSSKFMQIFDQPKPKRYWRSKHRLEEMEELGEEERVTNTLFEYKKELFGAASGGHHDNNNSQSTAPASTHDNKAPTISHVTAVVVGEDNDSGDRTEISVERIVAVMKQQQTVSLKASPTLTPSVELPPLQQRQQQNVIADVEVELKRRQSEFDDRRQQLAQRQQQLDDVTNQLEQLELLEKEAVATNAEKVELLKSLLAERQRLRTAQQKLKQDLNEKIGALQTRLDDLNRMTSIENGGSGVAVELDRQLSEQLHSIEQQLQQKRLENAEILRRLAKIQREQDSTSISELEVGQYRRRLLELCAQVLRGLKQLKQLNALHNSLHDVRQCMEKEIVFLDSLFDEYSKVAGPVDPSFGGRGRREIHEKLSEVINKQLRATQNSSERMLATKKGKKAELLKRKAELVQVNRRWLMAVKEMNELLATLQ